jgi:triosephosphate isomerase
MTSARTPLIVGNWKMHKTIGDTRAFCDALRAYALPLDDVDAVVCPPFTALPAAAEKLAGTRIGLGAQNMNWADSGAYTGEISPLMLRELGVAWVVLGHSERRTLFGELDERINAKVHSALRCGITPIVAVGETAADHAAGHARERVEAQIHAAFASVSAEDAARCVVAYEPIWAIGSGVPETPADADAVMGAIRASAPGLADARILYGGSVKPQNIAAFTAQPNIDGALVGGASLDPASFAALLDGARRGVEA